MAKGISIHYVFKAQCLNDGSAYFGSCSSDELDFKPNDIPLPFGRRLQEKIAKYGRHRIAIQVMFSSPLRDDVDKRLREILKETRNHPLSLNETSEELQARAIEAASGPKSESHKASLSEALKGNQNGLGLVMSEEAKESIGQFQKKFRKGMKWIHNPETNEEMQLEPDEELLTGFKFGRLKKKDREKGPKGPKTLDMSAISDAQRAKLPKFILDAIDRQRGIKK